MDDHHYVTPVDPRVARLAALLSASERESFEEKAAIRTHLGELEREQAEVEALLDVLSTQPASSARLFRLTLADDASQWVLAFDLAPALSCLQALGGSDIAEAELDDVLHQQFGGVAFLGTSA